ncbi:MAG: hypothetical protein JW904_04155 [Spirochaetales bacterium]|nr:hypothetical protein [Spirochaetales bacterium]
MRMFLTILGFLLFFGISAFGDGQAYISSAMGNGFSITQDEKSEFFSADGEGIAGKQIISGNIINVEPDTVLTIGIRPSNIQLEISESSSFLVKAISDNGVYDIEVFYGRIRTNMTAASGYDPLVINDAKIIPRKSNSNFGFDSAFIAAEGVAAQNIYCFSGEIDVSKTITNASGKKEVQVVKLLPREMVAIKKAGNDIAFSKQLLTAEAARVWLNEEILPLTNDSVAAGNDRRTGLDERGAAENRELLPRNSDDMTTPAVSAKNDKNPEDTPPVIKRRIKYPPNLDEVPTDPQSFVEQENTVESGGSENTAEIKTEEPVKTENGKETAAKDQTKAENGDTTDKAADNGEQPEKKQEGFFVAFRLDMSLEITYLMHNPPTTTIPIPGADVLFTLLDIIAHLRAGFVLDAHIMFWDIIGLGVETGLMYNSFGFGSVITHNLDVPLAGSLRFTLGPAYAQVYAGILFSGYIIQDPFLFIMNNGFTYEAGIRAGIKLGNSAFFVSGQFFSPTVDGFFNGSSVIRVGGGIMFSFI